MKKQNSWGFAFWIVLFVILLVFMQSSRKSGVKEDIPYSVFKQSVKEGKVANVLVSPDMIEGEFLSADGKPKKFKTIPLDDPKLVEDMENSKVSKFSGKPQNGWIGPLLMSWGPIILLILFWLWMIRGMNGAGKQAMAFGKSKAKLADNEKTKKTFKDVAGCGEAKEELQEIVEFLKNPAKFQKLGGKIPKGVLLFGAPGTGKTLLAKAVAGEAGVPFFSSSGSEFVEMFVGVGASRVRDLFDQGRKNAPCLLFVDEIDAVGRHRGAGLGGGHDEREQTLNQLLVEMDGFDTKEGVIIIAATNRPDVLDPALLRPGRFDRQVVVPSPDLNDREEILKVHVRDIKISKEVDLKVIARRTPGFVGADLANLTNEAALLAARKDLTEVGMKNFEEAIDRIIAGPQRKSRIISDKEKSIIAYHEAGHTIVAKVIPGMDPVHKVSIVPRGPALGYTLQLPLEDKFLTSRTEINGRLSILLGGRAAEELVFNEITTGAQNDIARATEIATKMVTEFGMSDKVGTLALGTESEEIFLGRDISRNKKHSDKTAEIIDEEIKNIIAAAKERSEKILKDNMEKLKYMVEMLIEREFLTGDEVDAIMKGEKLQAKEEIQENKIEMQQEKEAVKPVEETRSPDKKEIKEEPKIIAEEVKPDKKSKKNKQDSSQNELFDKIGKNEDK
ncbi:MAG: ATP-dependent zinc metalloprotease FtsH [Endomicrobiaceae bacterium]|jgi:cell division protease FtsH|nr:ATP-dependent zinc metalloprotease FtsH [Endomicrobiaceae bacterium]MDD3730618.1 ATP-dependent zinc metalloprotease FtsH [Endomicrobiaceae bacterium]